MNESIEKVRLHGFEKNNQTTLLENALFNWINLVNQYSERHDEDATYWYNERATLSVFAAAVWQTKDSCALEEFSNKKNNKSNNQKNNQKNGRCDLYMLLDDTSYACEAKQAWQKVVFRGTANLKTTLDVIKSANSATRELSVDEADKRLSLTFCIPYFRAKDLQEQMSTEVAITSNIHEFCEELHNKIAANNSLCDAVAYVFPKKSRLLHTEAGIYYPGVILLIKKISKGYRLKT